MVNFSPIVAHFHLQNDQDDDFILNILPPCEPG